jgi:hypothetical protein
VSSMTYYFITWFRPSGKITSLDLPDLGKKFYTVRYPPNQPEQAHFVSTVLSKEDLYHDFFHFYVTKPSPLKRCAKCHKNIDTNCIQTSVICILFYHFIDNNQREGSSCESCLLFELIVLWSHARGIYIHQSISNLPSLASERQAIQ